MAHVRKQIRDRLEAILSPAVVPTNRIYQMRAFPLPEGNTQGLSIYTNQTEYRRSTMGGSAALRKYDVVVKVTIEYFAGGDSEAVFSTVDEKAVAIENALGGDLTLSGIVKDITLTNVTIDVNTDGGVAIGSVVVELDAFYRVSETDAETSLP